jgi:TRAP-type C4-dicarboxylate transport system, periplasmic component
MFTKKIFRTLLTAVAITFFAHAAVAEIVLKLGTTGRLGMPIGDAIDQALIPAMDKASGGKMKIEPHYQRSLCSKQNVVNKLTKDL